MADYRLYFNNDKGRIKSVTELECVDDKAALAISKVQLGSSSGELWQLTRRVARLKPDQSDK